MKRAILFFCTACLCFSLASRAEAQRMGPGTAAKPKPVVSAVKIVKVSEETQLTTVAGSSVEARNETRFVIISLEFQPGKEPIAADDLQLVGSAEQEFRCAGLGDGRGKYGYCLDPNFKFDRGRIWENEEYFDGLCIERSGVQVAGGTFSTNKPVAVFIVPNNVPIRGLALRYKGISVRLSTATQPPSRPTPAQASSSADGTARIEGMLGDADTKKPLPNVEIELSRADEGVPKNEKEVGKIRTDVKGQYSFSGLKPGKYLMSITAKYFREEDRPCRPAGWFVVSARTADGGFVQIAMSNEITLSANQVSKMNLDLKCN